MHPAPVHIFCASNRSWIMPLSVMLASVVDNFSPGRTLIIHIISNDATQQDRDNVRASIRNISPKLENIEIHWYSVDSPVLEKLIPHGDDPRFSRDVFARLFAPHLLPPSCERVIHLDADMVVLTDIAKLYDATAESPAILHAVQDMACAFASSSDGVFDYVERGIPPDSRMFNCGLMVLNFKLWRERNLTESMLDYLVRFGRQIHWADQGAMNAFLYNDWVPLDPRWNQTTHILFEKHKAIAGYSAETWRLIENDPYIVHFTGEKKPWGPGWRYVPRRVHFFNYLQRTVFKNTVLHYPYPEKIIGTRAYLPLWHLGHKIFPQGFRPLPKTEKAALLA